MRKCDLQIMCSCWATGLAGVIIANPELLKISVTPKSRGGEQPEVERWLSFLRQQSVQTDQTAAAQVLGRELDP